MLKRTCQQRDPEKWMAELNGILQSLNGALISKIEIDFRITLVLEEKGAVVLSCPFEVTLGDGPTHIVDPEGMKAEFIPILELVNESVTDLSIVDEQLFMTASNRVRIRAYADPHYEAWCVHLEGPEGLMVIALPGGSLEVWGPNQQSQHGSRFLPQQLPAALRVTPRTAQIQATRPYPSLPVALC